MLRLFDTALGSVVPFEPAQAGRVTMYVCGPTVSGEPHIGHGRFTVVWDMARRYLRWSGFDVRYVSNVTDIEDKILARAREENRPPREVAEHYEQVWWDTMAKLAVERPDETPHATEYVERMVELIGELIDRGHAYEGGDGVYFSAASVEGYGLLARQSIESLQAGARVEVVEEAGKRSPIDFVLWKLARPGEPEWPSPWGAGRPGWHTECVVMSLDLLGDGFDLHTGGLDLAFPHHENERAQALAAGRQFARRWAHNGMIVDETGEKMSKSVGNTTSLPQLLDDYDARAFRLQILQARYRAPLAISPQSLAANVRGVARLDAFAREFPAGRGGEADDTALARFRDRMDDDLDTPAAVAVGFDLLREARAASGTHADQLAAAVYEIFEVVLGVPLHESGQEVPPEALAKAAGRDEARTAGDYATADTLRAELQADGWIVEDGPDGTTIRR